MIGLSSIERIFSMVEVVVKESITLFDEATKHVEQVTKLAT